MCNDRAKINFGEISLQLVYFCESQRKKFGRLRVIRVRFNFRMKRRLENLKAGKTTSLSKAKEVEVRLGVEKEVGDGQRITPHLHLDFNVLPH